MCEETGEKTVGTDERIARRLIEEHPDLVGEMAIAFDGLFVDFDKQFPSLACTMKLIFSSV